MPTKSDDDIKLPLSKEDEERIREVLKGAGIKPGDFFHLPQQAVPNAPGEKRNPNVPAGRTKETYNGQKGDGTFRDLDFPWQPDCGEPFTIVVEQVWTPPPAGLANRFDLWSEFATFRAILICLRGRCKRVHPLGCEWTWELKFANGEVLAVARFVFECVEL